MRIIGGTSRGRRLSGPRGAAIRPTADQVKGALFNILADRIVGARFLDLFAGTGNIGLEALSRGATQATFVESNPIACRLLEANVRRCGFERAAEVRPVPVSRFLKHTRGPAYDIVFLDPPYETQDAQRVLPSVVAANPQKHPVLALDERVELVRLATKETPRVEVEPFHGLLVDFVRQRGAHAVIRGLRAVSDFELELQMALMNRNLDQSVETVFLMPSQEYIYLTSTIIKEVARLGGDLAGLVHPEIARRLVERLRGCSR